MKKIEKVAIVGATLISASVLIMIGLFVLPLIFPSQPKFTIVSDNGDLGVGWDENLNPIYNYTVYVKIKNTGADGSKTVYCEVTNWDLTT